MTSRKPSRPVPKPAPAAGIGARRRALDLLEAVLARHRSFDDALDDPSDLDAGDRALARKIAATTLRHLGSLDRVIAERLVQGLPEGLPRLAQVLRIGACQILFLDVPDHAAVDTSVRLVEADRKARGLTGLANAVLRGIARERDAILTALDPLDNVPEWLRMRWIAQYGAGTARGIAAIHTVEPPLDLTVKTGAADWARRLGGQVLPTGSVRLLASGPITALEGFEAGQWWVQDAAAALPARLLGDVSGIKVADLCAAPGGKTAQLAHAGARVVAIDRSEKRLERLKQNMARLGLKAELRVGDATLLDPAALSAPFDAVLIDAPCSATGTARGHPDVLLRKSMRDIEALARLQARLLDRAVEITRPGGRIVYCTCSLEREEGEEQVARLLSTDPRVVLDPIQPNECIGIGEFVVGGMLRTLPSQWPDPDPRLAGLDGFFAARFRRV